MIKSFQLSTKQRIFDLQVSLVTVLKIKEEDSTRCIINFYKNFKLQLPIYVPFISLQFILSFFFFILSFNPY